MNALGLAIDDVFVKHDTGSGHPERPERIDVLNRALKKEGVVADSLALPVRAATSEELKLCHTESYIDLVAAECERAEFPRDLSTGDVVVSRGSDSIARKAVGAALGCVDAVFEKKCRRAFSVARPPGHHASAANGMGFCLYNQAAVAARYAQEKHDIERVAIVDWDVHHGNGTQDIFYQNGTVFYFSTHQHPFYPGTGKSEETGDGEGKGMTLNCPLPQGSGMSRVSSAFREQFAQKMKTFRPELVLVSAGFDSRQGDILGGFTLSDDDFAELTGILVEIAETYAEGRLVSILEGGYSLSGLVSASLAHARRLMKD